MRTVWLAPQIGQLAAVAVNLALGGSVNSWRAGLATPHGALGLAGQGVFAPLPLVALRSRQRG